MNLYSVYYTDFYVPGEEDSHGENLGHIYAEDDNTAAIIAKAKHNIPDEAVQEYDHRTYFLSLIHI